MVLLVYEKKYTTETKAETQIQDVKLLTSALFYLKSQY